MSSRRSGADIADRQWPDLGVRLMPRPVSLRMEHLVDDGRDVHDRRDFEPPLHPSEVHRRPRGLLGRLVPSPRVAIAFGLGIAATLVWQTWGSGPRQALANRFPRLAWLAPASVSASNPGGGASSEQLAGIARDLGVVRQEVDRVSADLARLQAAKPDPSMPKTAAATSLAPQPSSRKPASSTR